MSAVPRRYGAGDGGDLFGEVTTKTNHPDSGGIERKSSFNVDESSQHALGPGHPHQYTHTHTHGVCPPGVVHPADYLEY